MTEQLDRIRSSRVEASLVKQLAPVGYVRAGVQEQALQAIEARTLDSIARPSSPLAGGLEFVVPTRLAHQAREQAASCRQRQPRCGEF